MLNWSKVPVCVSCVRETLKQQDTSRYMFHVENPVPVQFSDLRSKAKSCEKKTRMPYKIFLMYIDNFTYGFGLINGKRPNQYDAWLNHNLLQYIDDSSFL
jgi:hypothetical protein